MADLVEIETREAWDRAVPILRQLWSHRSEAFVRSWWDEEEYRPFALATDEGFVAVAGCYCQTVIHHERGLWVHDLVVDEAHRGEGYGRALFESLEDWAAERDCAHVALVCANDNDEAHAFYDAVGTEPFGQVLESEV